MPRAPTLASCAPRQYLELITGFYGSLRRRHQCLFVIGQMNDSNAGAQLHAAIDDFTAAFTPPEVLRFHVADD